MNEADPARHGAYLRALAAASLGGLKAIGFGALTIPADISHFLRARVPDGLWWLDYQQNPNVHSKVTDESISLRMHVDAFQGDRPSNEAVLDLLRGEIERDLATGLHDATAIDWRAAGPRGGNQVLELSAPGGVLGDDPMSDAAWLVATARTWADVMRRHPMNELRDRVAEVTAP
jgi:hypothetical protein